MKFLTLAPILIAFCVSGCAQQERFPPINGGNANASSTAQNSAGNTAASESSRTDIIIAPDSKVAVTKNFYFVIDGSGSMSESPPRSEGKQFHDKMEGAKWAIQEAAKLIPEDANIGFYAFDRNGEGERLALGKTDHMTFVKNVNGLRAGGGTPLAEGIYEGVKALVKQRSKQLGYGEYRLIVVTDGAASSIPEAVAVANENGIPIYGIGLGVGRNHPLRNGTIYSDASSITELKDRLAKTVGEMESFDGADFDFD